MAKVVGARIEGKSVATVVGHVSQGKVIGWIGMEGRKAMSADDILHAFVAHRLSNGDEKETEVSKQLDLGRKLSVLARLPLSDLENPRFVDLVNRISIFSENANHYEDDYTETSLKIHPFPHLIIVETSSDGGRFSVTIRRDDILSADGYDARHHSDPNTTGLQHIFTTVGLNTVRCDPAKWAALEVTCFGCANVGGASFLLRCFNALTFYAPCYQLEDYDQPSNGYLCYPFFREFRPHLTQTIRECLGTVLLPELVVILVDYSLPPFERQKPHELMCFQQHEAIHEYCVPKPKKKNSCQ